MRLCSIAVLAVVVACSGCGVKHIRALADAETVFNRASQADNRERAATSAGVVTSASSLADYRLADRLLDDLIQKQGAQLKSDRLFCTAVALQALARWRVGQYDAALQSARAGDECVNNPATTQSAPRDAALVRAIPGLVRIDQAKVMVDNGKLGDGSAIETLVRDAHSDLSAAAGLVPGDSPVREYLLMAHLAAVRVLQESTVSENLSGGDLTRVNTAVNNIGSCWIYRYSKMQSDERIDYKARAEAWRILLGLGPIPSSEPASCAAAP